MLRRPPASWRLVGSCGAAMATCASLASLGLLASGDESDELPPRELLIAFIGDQGAGSGAVAVLQLIAAEGAEAVLHAGDFDYRDDPVGWNARIDSELGADFPYFAAIGNHDENRYYAQGGYRQQLEARMLRLGIPWSGDLGVQSEFFWRGLQIVATAPGVIAAGDGLYDLYIRDRFAASAAPWRISIWHKNQHRMQTGGKSDETGWGVYEESRRAGALIATAHEHAYSRTHLLSSMQQQTIADTSNALVLRADDPQTGLEDEGRSFAFVSGLGGNSVRDQELFGDWFAHVYTSTQGARRGALFGVFHVEGDPRLARFYFKNIDGVVVDEFTVRSTAGCPDSDGDAICDASDSCLLAANPSQLDSDFDGHGNACDPDYDNDGQVGNSDLVRLLGGLAEQYDLPRYRAVHDADGDGAVGDPELLLLGSHYGAAPGPSGLACAGAAPCSPCTDLDADGDGVCDALDDCQATFNPSQRDGDHDGYGNACDADHSNDGVVANADLAQLRASFGCSVGAEGCSDELDADDDGVVGQAEFELLRRSFGAAPGPSGLPCAGTRPCLGR